MSATKFKDMTDHITEGLGGLKQEIPDVFKGFNQMMTAAAGEGALDVKTKKLIALGMAIYMGGGPSMMYASEAWHGFLEALGEKS